MFKIMIFLAIVAFVGLALYFHYNKTPVEDSIPKRVLAALVAGGVAFGAWVMSFFQSVPTP